MDTIKFSCNVNTNIPDRPLNLKILLDNDTVIFNELVIGEQTISYNIPDVDGNRTIVFSITGKNDTHVLKDGQGNIIDSTEISITNICFDDLDITPIILINPLAYKHNFNGYGEETVEKFYDIAGCNGDITLEFTTPFYLWLLENM